MLVRLLHFPNFPSCCVGVHLEVLDTTLHELFFDVVLSTVATVFPFYNIDLPPTVGKAFYHDVEH